MDWFPYGNGLCHERVKQVNADWVQEAWYAIVRGINKHPLMFLIEKNSDIIFWNEKMPKNAKNKKEKN